MKTLQLLPLCLLVLYPWNCVQNHPILQHNFSIVLFSFSNPLKLYPLGSHLVAKSMFDSMQPHGLLYPRGASVHGILQPNILEWVAIPFSKGSSRSRD